MNRYNVPRIAFVNKMDRAGADFLRVVRHDPRAPARQSGAHPAADRRRGDLRRGHRPRQDEGYLLGHGNPGHEVRVPRDPAPRSRPQAEEYRAQDDRGRRRRRRRAHRQIPERRRAQRRRDQARPQGALAQERDRAVHVRHRVQEQGRAGAARRRHRIHAVADRDAADQGPVGEGRDDHAHRAATTSRSRRWRSRSSTIRSSATSRSSASIPAR